VDRCRDPLRCIVPPSMLERIARHGSDRQRAWALSTLTRDATIRHARVQNQLLRGVRGMREGPDALAALEHRGADREHERGDRTLDPARRGERGDAQTGRAERRDGDGDASMVCDDGHRAATASRRMAANVAWSATGLR
jgi:hypothetical protein